MNVTASKGAPLVSSGTKPLGMLRMRHRNTLIIFSRLPRLGTVKTRLARVAGAVAARQLHRRLVLRTLRRLAHNRRWRTVLAITPERGHWREWPRRLPRLAQGPGDLGQRMGHCLRRSAAPRAVLVGTDIPEISAAAIARAFKALGQARFVFGPARDGGYWLIGWRRLGAWPRRALTDVRWSSVDALADSWASLGRSNVTMVDTLDDFDTLPHAPRGVAPGAHQEVTAWNPVLGL